MRKSINTFILSATVGILYSIFGASYTYAQTPLGMNPARLNWNVIHTKAGDFIYPDSLEEKAMRIANIVNYQNDTLSHSVGHKRKKLSFVIQNQTVIPNGYVALAPFRSEFFSTPPEGMQFLGSMDWLDVLSIHENRHAQQFSNTKYGITKLAYLLQGESGWAITSVFSVPNWYFEGDAVVTETALTDAGRGRTPSFTAQQRALAQSNTNYSYQKARNQSFKDNVPNQYPLGFMMLTHLRNEKGNNIMVPVLKDASRYKSIFYPFSRAMKKHSGFTTGSLYRASWENAKKTWAAPLKKSNVVATTPVTSRSNKTVTNYSFPQFTSTGKIIAFKNSYKQTDRIVEIDENGEKKIFNPGINLGQYFHSENNKITWTELALDPRRNNRSYSNIFVLNQATNKKTKLTKKGRFFSPILHKDGKTVLAIDVKSNQTCAIQQIDIASGKIESVLEFASDEFISRLSYTEDKTAVVYLMKKQNQLAIWKGNLTTKKKTQLTPWTSHVLDAVRVRNNYVYFSAGFDGIDNIYRVYLNGDQRIQQLTFAAIGAYEPCVSKDGKTLVFTEHTKMGKVISKMDLNPLDIAKLIPVNITEPSKMEWQDKVAAKAEGGNVLKKIPTKKFETEDYKGALKGIKLHTWSIDGSNVSPAMTLRFNNYLNDFSAIARGGYNLVEQGSFYSGQVSYGRLFPVLNAGIEQRFRQADFLTSNQVLGSQQFNELVLSGGAHIPLNMIHGNYNTNFSFNANLQHHIVDNINTTDGPLPNNSYNAAAVRINYATKRRTAIQNYDSRLGLSASLEHFHNLTAFSEQKATFNSMLYLPGIGKNHSLRIRYARQNEPLSNAFQQFDSFFYARGYQRPINNSYVIFSVNYGLTLAYPDLGFAGITYFKRIRTNLFYDQGQAKFLPFAPTQNYPSAGVEILFDNTFFNLIPVSFGLRGSYVFYDQPLNPGGSFPISFFIAGGL